MADRRDRGTQVRLTVLIDEQSVAGGTTTLATSLPWWRGGNGAAVLTGCAHSGVLNLALGRAGLALGVERACALHCTTRRGCRILREAMGDVLSQVVTGDSIEI